MTDTKLEALASFVGFLEEALREAGRRCGEAPTDGAFSLVEHLWHLADLEREGFGVRITRLRSEEHPDLPDFDGDRIARERDYRNRDAAKGLEAFRTAREANLATLRSLTAEERNRSGHLENFGPITLRDLPELMRNHDTSHHTEIDKFIKKNRDRHQFSPSSPRRFAYRK